jgi:tape measure domain-containing protein
MADSRTLELILRLKDEASSALSGVSKRLENFQTRIEPAADASRKFALGLSAAGAAVGGLGLLAIKEAANIESLKFGLNAVSGSAEETEKQLARLREVAKLPGLGFKEAIQGSINLQAAGLNADLAERSLKAFGNALATVGRGKADLDGVTLALTQISAKGKVSAQEILQLQERLPQIRQAMIAAFGTADTEALQKQGIGSETFISAIVAEFEKLPPITSGLNNQIENLRDAWSIFLANEGAKLIEWAKQFIQVLIDIVENYLPKWIDKTAQLVNWLGQHKEVLIIVAGALLGALMPALIAAISSFALLAVTLAPFILGGAIVGGLVAGILWIAKHWDFIELKTKEVWQRIKDYLYQTYDGVRLIIKEKWDAIGKYFSDIWDGIKSTFRSAIDWIMDKLSPLLNALDKVKGGISSIGGIIGSGFSAVGKAIGVNDAIISPNGNVITTHPDDYLIATKNPGSLGGSGIVVNVYGDVSGQELVDKVSEGIMNSLRLNARLPV